MTLLRDQKPLTNNKTLNSILQHRAELGKLKTKLEKTNITEYRKQEFFAKKTIYISSGIKWHNYDNCNNHYSIYNHTAKK